MKYGEYRFKFYLNANHAIYLSGVLGQNHPHTWEFTLDTLKVRDDFVQFDEIEKAVEQYFSAWQDKNINITPPFDTLNPTLENLCVYFKKALNELLRERGWLLRKIELAETPSRSYIIDMSDEPAELAEYSKNSLPDNIAEKKLDEILSKTSSEVKV